MSESASPKPPHYLDELNDVQRQAAENTEGPVLVIAGPGSGKTRVLTYRIAHLIEKGTAPWEILALTFTNKSAREMKERIGKVVGKKATDIWAGTFHSLFARILRVEAKHIGYPSNFTIYDTDDSKSLINSILKEMNLDKKVYQANAIKNRISSAKSSLITPKLYAMNAKLLTQDKQAKMPLVSKIYTQYVARCKKAGAMDFDDLLFRLYELLQNHQEVAQKYREKFRYVLVDEYQDTNVVQCEIVDLLVGKSKNLMVVGDDAQSIYSWRGADMENILKFHTRYPEAVTYKIETNYRSQPEILELSNAAIAANTEQIRKELKAAREGGEMVPALVTVPDPRQQADFVAQRVQELVEEGVEEQEIAVLYRAHYQSMEVQMEFTARMIPFHITSGLRFFEQAHVKDVSSYIRFVVNRKDEVSFKRMALMLPGVGDASAEKRWRGWLASNAAQSETIPESFTQVLLDFKVPTKAKTHWEQMCYTLDELVLLDEKGETKFAAPADMIFSVLEGVYEEYMQNSFDNYENRKQDIGQLQTYATQYVDVEEFLAQLSLMSSVDGDPSKKRQEQEKGVTLSSIHQAKGLEWKVVFLVWLADGMFPNGKILDADDDRALEEERRLFYVALTRAKDQLYLSYPMMNPKSYSGDVYQSPSRFLDDFPAELLDEWTVSGW